MWKDKISKLFSQTLALLDQVKITFTAYKENIGIRNAHGAQRINVIQFKQFRKNMSTLKNHIGFVFLIRRF